MCADLLLFFFFFSSRRRHTRWNCDWSSDVVLFRSMLAHKASHEGRVAVEVMAGENVAFAPRAIPAVVFTDPELAWAGLTESQEIGRASCRERVESPGGGAAVKRKRRRRWTGENDKT